MNNLQEFTLNNAAEEIRDIVEPVNLTDEIYIGLEHIEQRSLHLIGIGNSSEVVSAKKKFESSDILFGSLRPYFRKVIKPNFSGVCSTDITVIRAKSDFDQSFLFYFLANQKFIDYATNISNGTRMPRASWKVLCDSKWLFPSYNEQKKIGEILSAYDDLIEDNTRRIQILEEMAQTIFREWFVNFRFPGHEQVRMVESELGLIPEGWETGRLSDVLEVLESGSRPKGGIDSSETEIPSIGAENVLGLGKYDYSKDKCVSRDFFEKMTRGHVKHNDVLLYKDGASLGRKSMFRDGFPYSECCVNEHVFILRTNEKCTQPYLFFWLDQPEMTRKIINLNSNAAQPGINQVGVKGLPIIIPPKDLLQDFEKVIDPILSLLFILAKKNRILSQTRDLILPKLISGESIHN